MTKGRRYDTVTFRKRMCNGDRKEKGVEEAEVEGNNKRRKGASSFETNRKISINHGK